MNEVLIALVVAAGAAGLIFLVQDIVEFVEQRRRDRHNIIQR
jgi:hypothetical protein